MVRNILDMYRDLSEKKNACWAPKFWARPGSIVAKWADRRPPKTVVITVARIRSVLIHVIK